MPFIRIIRSRTIDRETYEAVNSTVDLDHKHPLGLLMHAAGEVDGRWQVVNVWESKEWAERFDHECLEPTVRELTGGELEREVTGYEVDHLVTP